jgi:hypothetical protein
MRSGTGSREIGLQHSFPLRYRPQSQRDDPMSATANGLGKLL